MSAPGTEVKEKKVSKVFQRCFKGLLVVLRSGQRKKTVISYVPLPFRW